MDTISALYIDDSTSRYMRKALNELTFKSGKIEYNVNCLHFDWNIKNDKENERLLETIENNGINCFLIDSALYNPDSSDLKFLGIWIAYYINSSIPRSHIAIVSSKFDQEKSLVPSSFSFLEKISKNPDETIISEYRKLFENWAKDDILFKKCCKEFSAFNAKKTNQISDDINVSLSRMESKDKLTSQDFKEVISLLEGLIENEE